MNSKDTFEVLYIDIRNTTQLHCLNEIVEKKNVVLLLDNAQLYKDQFDVKEYKFIVATYSPGAESVPVSPSEHISKCSHLPVYLTPFIRSDLTRLLNVHGYTLIPDTDTIHLFMQLIWNTTVNMQGWQGYITWSRWKRTSSLYSAPTSQREGRAIRGLAEVFGQFDSCEMKHVAGIPEDS